VVGTVDEPNSIGPDVPGYRHIRLLSATPMSRVYLAEELTGERRRVALKVLDLSTSRADFIARFRAEVTIAWALRHPHIVETFHAGEIPGHHYLAMRHVAGPDLDLLLRSGPLPVEKTLRMAGQIADALDAAHRRQLVHRDVKPANILLDNATGDAFLCDFGIAKDLRAQAITQYGAPLTPLYAAPEQQTGRRVTRHADVYALTGVLYHCLTGRPPFDRSTTHQVYEAHRKATPPLISTARPDLPARLDEVFRRGLAKRPPDRYASCTELVTDLAAILGGTPRPPRTRPAFHWSPARIRVAAVAGVIVVAVAAVPWLIAQHHRSTPTQATKPPASTAFPTSAERTLIDLVGDSGCRRAPATETTGFTGVRAAVDCAPPASGATAETYVQFDSVSQLRAAFNRDAGTAKAPTGVDCATGRAPGFLGNRRYDLRSVDLGGLLCYPGADSGLVLEWSVEPLRVLGRATGADPAALTAWWASYFGPPTAAIVSAVNKQSSPPFPTERESALLAHIPAASRNNCVRPSDQQVRMNVGDTPVTAVVCGPTSGAAIVFYYQFPDPVTMNASYGAPDPGGADCTTATTDFGGEHSYSRGGETGRLRCFTTDNTGERDMIWTDDRLNIEGMAFQCGDPLAVLDWWRNDAGPS